MIEQVSLKTILMLDTEFCNAYYQLNEKFGIVFVDIVED